MKTSTAARIAPLALLLVLVAGACSSLGIAPPGGGVGSGGDAGSGGGAAPGGGALVGNPPIGPGAPGAPDAKASFVVPRGGQRDVHPVGIASLSATVDGRTVQVQATWWSGVEPCNVLDSIRIVQDGQTFTVTLLEGSGDPNTMCIEIAVLKGTTFSLGPLDPGTYTIRPDSGDASPITFTVS